MYNLSFETALFLQKMKVAKAIPNFKQGNKHLFNNYRPFSKILEKLFNSRLENVLNKYKILNHSQYGFREKSTTTLAIMEATEKLYFT